MNIIKIIRIFLFIDLIILGILAHFALVICSIELWKDWRSK